MYWLTHTQPLPHWCRIAGLQHVWAGKERRRRQCWIPFHVCIFNYSNFRMSGRVWVKAPDYLLLRLEFDRWKPLSASFCVWVGLSWVSSWIFVPPASDNAQGNQQQLLWIFLGTVNFLKLNCQLKTMRSVIRIHVTLMTTEIFTRYDRYPGTSAGNRTQTTSRTGEYPTTNAPAEA